VSLDAGRRHDGSPAHRQVNRSGLGSTTDPTGSGARRAAGLKRLAVRVGPAIRLPTHLAYPTSHTPYGPGPIGSSPGSVQRQRLTRVRARTSRGRIRPDRDMRQFDGSIV